MSLMPVPCPVDRRQLHARIAACLLLAWGITGPGQSFGATLNVDGAGQLLGATGVIVNGDSYDVVFMDGTCAALFSGCDEPSDVTFQDRPTAMLAAQALGDQVFRNRPQGSFDSEPELTVGCSDLSQCLAATPYNLRPGGPSAGTYGWANFAPGGFLDHGLDYSVGRFDDSSSFANVTFAIWAPTVIPEPSTAVLVGIGLLGLSGRRRARVAAR